MSSGIYQITNQVNGKRYIGSAVNLKRRWQEHLKTLRRGEHENEHLQHAYDKYGEESFEFSVLECVDDTSQPILREQHYLDTLKPEYNIAPLAGSTLGAHYSLSACAKMRAAWTPERRAAQSERQRGKHHSEETRRRQSEAWTPERKRAQTERQKGRYFSSETRKKMSEARTAWWRRIRQEA